MTRRLSAFLAVMALVAGCASGAARRQATPTTAAVATEATALGRQLEDVVQRHQGESGFLLINEGREAFAVRTALAEVAEVSIDAQYFLWAADAVGTILLSSLVRAADRGVRVRLLVDDLYVKGRDSGIAGLDAHPNIEIRLYNPFRGRNRLSLGRRLDFLLEFGRLNHRMHNKLFVVDNQMAVVGGRNIADAYFGVDPELNFRDMDAAVAGPVVRDLSAGFDAYWNSRTSVPISALRGPPSTRAVNRVYERLTARTAQRLASFPYRLETDGARILERVKTLAGTLSWAPSRVVWADPESGPEGSNAGASSAVALELGSLTDATRFELVTQSPYFIPGSDLSKVRQLRARGVGTHVLTNSLASTDEPPAYAVYARDRRRLLEQGVELYEVRPDAASRQLYTADAAGPHRLALHAKVAVFDRRTVYIGSFNLDPRSRAINTEIALVVNSAPLAEALLALLEPDFQPENSWRVVLDGDREMWLTRDAAPLVGFHRAPATGFWRRLAARVIGVLPIRGQL